MMFQQIKKGETDMKYEKIYRCLLTLFLLFGSLMRTSITYANSQSSQAGISFQENGFIDVSVLLTKKDNETKKELPNAIFELWKIEGKEKKLISSSLVTNEQGQIKMERLFPGKYAFIEVITPKGYQIDQTPLFFEVNLKKTNVNLTMYNKKVKNETDQSFPKTGEKLSNHWLEYLGFLLFLTIFYLIKKRTYKT